MACFNIQDENKLVMVDLCDTVVVNVLPADNPIRLVLLDVGISASLTENDLQNFKDVFTAVVIGEVRTLNIEIKRDIMASRWPVWK